MSDSIPPSPDETPTRAFRPRYAGALACQISCVSPSNTVGFAPVKVVLGMAFAVEPKGDVDKVCNLE